MRGLVKKVQQYKLGELTKSELKQIAKALYWVEDKSDIGKYTFQDLRRRITKAEQEAEIGDIRRLSYTLTEPEEDKEIKSEFEPQRKKKKKKHKELDEVELLIKKHREEKKKEDAEYDYWNS